MNPAYRLDNPDDVFSPGLLFFKDLIAANIQAMLRRVGSAERLRPHVKTHKCPQVVRLEQAAGITKFKCATVAEAEMLALCGVRDALLSYPMVGPNCERVVAFLKKYPACKLSILGDHPAPLEKLSALVAKAGGNVGVYLDLDVGQHRTGIAAGPDAARLYRKLATLPGLTAEGLHVYDGHNHQESIEDRTRAVNSLLEPVLALRQALEKEGVAVPRVIVGGTPTFPAYARLDLPGLECSPGTCVLHDDGYGSRFRDMAEFVPAALLLTRVISRPTPTRVTFDLGYKAVASDPPAGKRSLLLNVERYEPVLQNEEHFVIETPEAERWQPGDVAYAIPTHICPTVALHQEAYVVEGGKVREKWAIVGRDRRLTV
ncbi:MAG: D-TA family PLP-dependent enzyme [Gemmataceae bacterium]